MKKYLMSVLCLIIVTLALVFSTYNDEKQERIVVTSFYPVYIAALNVTEGVEDITIKNLTNEFGGCVHDYTLTPNDMIKLSNAKALVINGSGMESFILDITKNYPDMQIVDLSNGVYTLEAMHSHDHSHEDEENMHHINSHTFVSIDNHIIQVKNLASMLAKLDNENAKTYMQNADNYVTKLKNLKDKMHLQLKKYEGEKVIALHESFAYFAKDFNLDLVDVIQIEEGQTLSAQSVKHITEHIKEYDVKLIVKDANYESSIANSIAKDNNVATFAFDPVVSGENNKDAYITKMENNLNNILLSLKAGE